MDKPLYSVRYRYCRVAVGVMRGGIPSTFYGVPYYEGKVPTYLPKFHDGRDAKTKASPAMDTLRERLAIVGRGADLLLYCKTTNQTKSRRLFERICRDQDHRMSVARMHAPDTHHMCCHIRKQIHAKQTGR